MMNYLLSKIYMYTTSLQTQDLTPQQQEFLEQYQVKSLIKGEIEANYEIWESVHSASEEYFSFEEWSEFCSNHQLG